MAAFKVFLLLAAGVAGVQCACTQGEVQTLMACLLPYNDQFIAALGQNSQGSTCNRDLITDTLCRSYTNIVTCANGAQVSDTTCRPSAISQINGNLVIPCMIEDFQAVCTDSPDIDTGVQCTCTQGEVQTLMACLLPYNDQFIAALGLKSQGSTCNRDLITDALCSSYTDIVTCANSAQVSDTTCRPCAISQINAQLVIPCMIENFQAVCTDSPDINTGVQCTCTQGEVQTLMACLLPYNDQFIAALGQNSQGSTCNRDLITDALCSSYTNIVTCANGAQVSDTTCRPCAIGQINGNLVIPCMIENFQAVCTDSPDINTGVQCACTQGEVQTLMACLLPYNDQFITALGQKSQGSTCNRTLITDALCSSYTNIVTCANSAQVSDTTCRPCAIGQINGNLVIPCSIENFQAVCTDSPDINTGGSSSIHPGWTTVNTRGGSSSIHPGWTTASTRGGSSSIQPGWTTANTRGAGGSGSIHAGWTTVLVIAVAQVVALLSSASFH